MRPRGKTTRIGLLKKSAGVDFVVEGGDSRESGLGRFDHLLLFGWGPGEGIHFGFKLLPKAALLFAVRIEIAHGGGIGF